MNHATVLRRISQLDDRLGARLFDKLPSGYRMTEAAEDVLGLAEQMEASSNLLESRLLGRDQALFGMLRVTMAPTIASRLLMPCFAAFAQARPQVEIAILTSDEPVNLTNREADVAIRVVYNRDTLPANLHGLKGPELFGGVYLSRELLAAWRAGEVERVRWIVKQNLGIPDWAHEGEVPAADVPFRVMEADAQMAVRAAGAHLLFLPPYSPDLNPIEMVFAKFKTLFRKADRRTIEEAWREVGSLLHRFSPNECAAYMHHAGYAAITA